MIKFTNTSSESFRKKSEKILGVFTKTKQDLYDLTIEQSAYQQLLEDNLKQIEAEKKEVELSIKTNKGIIQKIEALLS
jgi:hypothetical protein